jgi:drug/metabolite transporter (DMT)-like permease
MSLRKYLVLLGVVLFGSFGDVLLSRGMKEFASVHGNLTLAHWTLVFYAISNPWVIAGMALLAGFFVSYLSALSWADLTYVLPATAIGYVVLALSARFWLHEHVPLTRWIGITMIVAGVGFVAGGPHKSEQQPACGEQSGSGTRHSSISKESPVLSGDQKA